MPIYEYKCQQCGTHYEVRQSVTDSPPTACEKCHGRLEKQWSRAGFQFKGGGWYVTDYAGKTSGEKSEKSAGGDSTTAGETASKPKDDAEKKPSAKKDKD